MPNVGKKNGAQATDGAADSNHGEESKHFIDSLEFLNVDEHIVQVVEENARELDDGRAPVRPHMGSEE